MAKLPPLVGAVFECFSFLGKLDLSQLFVMGHSFGGSTALLAASNDDRLIGCIALDPWMFPVAEETFELTKPVLVINTEMFVNAANVGKVREVASGACSAVLAGAVHLMHTDAPFLFRSNLIKSGLGNSTKKCQDFICNVKRLRSFSFHPVLRIRMTCVRI